MLSIIFLIFFLVWIFFNSTTTFSLEYLGEIRAVKTIERRMRSFFYYPFHKWFFKKKTYSLLVSASKISENMGRLGYGLSLCAVIYAFYQEPLWIPIVIVLSFLLLLIIFGDFLPHIITIRNKERAFALGAPISSLLLYLTFIFTFPFLTWESLFSERRRDKRGIAYIEDDLKETILQILYENNLKEPLNAFDKKLLASVIKFKERIVREVMVPRVDLFCLPSETSIKDAAQRLAEEGYSRSPIYRDTIDNIIGVLLYKDVLELYMECEKQKKDWKTLDEPIETLAKKVFYTPETKKVSQLLQEFRTKQMHLAIVIDEYGGTEGVVTIEDLLEELVGEIGDEYDVGDEAPYSLQPGGDWIVDARMTINDAEETFQIQIPQEGDYDTLGGYVFDVVKAIPPIGYIITHEKFDIEVINTTDRSIEKLKIITKNK